MIIPSTQEKPAIPTAIAASRLWRPPMPAATSASTTDATPIRIGRNWKCVARDTQVQVGDREQPEEDRRRRHQPCERVQPLAPAIAGGLDHRSTLARAACRR